MPTYLNSSRNTVTGDNFNLLFGAKTEIRRYIPIDQYPSVTKVSDSPSIRKTFNTLFSNVSAITNMSGMMESSSYILGVRNCSGVSNTIGDTITITNFYSITDNIQESIPLLQIIFTCIGAKDIDGADIQLWLPNQYPMSMRNKIDSTNELVSFQVTAITVTNSVDILIKTY